VASNFGSLASHESFAAKYGYTFPILVDAEKSMASAYSVLKSDGGTQRTVYVVDAEGIIRFGEQGMVKHDVLHTILKAL
jgi:peroxiredoxin Q/BCP